MRAVIQRVSEASVSINGEVAGKSGRGLMVLLGIEVGDTPADLNYIVGKITGLRIFDDENGVMNLSITDAGGQMLLISQFTLLADTQRGRRPSYIRAARPDEAVPLYEAAITAFRQAGIPTECGVFGADMKVSLVNDGPVTIIIDSKTAF